jgi:response regulator NasT
MENEGNIYDIVRSGIMNNYNIVVADSSETSRKKVCGLLAKKGYRTYQATDGAGALRIARSIFPDLVIMDINLWGINAFEVASIIEEDKLSTVVFITGSPNSDFYEKLRTMNIFAYINRPINPDQLYQIVEFSIINSNKISLLEEKVEKLESTLEARKKIDRAKGILIEKLKITENEAYKLLRKKSMDSCVSMEKIAEEIIKKYL